MNIVKTICNDLNAIRENRPLVHSITNFVVMNETANAILCLGALPIMAHAVEEVVEMVGIANALVLNIGTLEPKWIDAMELAGKRANELNIPIILDPVGAGATKFRIEMSKRLLENIHISILRGNAAEISTLAGVAAEVRGVESISVAGNVEQIAKQLALTMNCTVATTGVVDVVSNGKETVRIKNGHAMLSKVVGTGCMSDVIVASFAGIQPDPLIAAIGGLTAFGIAGEMAALVADGKPGTFHTELYNALYALDSQTLQSAAKIEMIKEE